MQRKRRIISAFLFPALVLIPTLAASQSGSNTLTFAPEQTFGYGDPNSITAADVNGDGKPDLLVARLDQELFSVLINTTPPGATIPSFAPQMEFDSHWPYIVTAADINGDGNADLIVANFYVTTGRGDSGVSVLLNTAFGATTPSFAAPVTFDTAANDVGSVAVADVNGDGRPDLIAANGGDRTVSILLNTTMPGATTPSFAPQLTIDVDAAYFPVIAADINGDGKPDVIFPNENNDTVSVLLNTTVPGATTPSFAPPQPFATGTNPYSTVVADVNGDGKPDVIVANSGDETVSVLLNTTVPGATTVSFATQQTFAASRPASIAVADLNGDGKPDILVANYTNVVVFLNTTASGATTSSFAPGQTFDAAYPGWVTTADINGDGKMDIVLADANNFASVLLNTTVFADATPPIVSGVAASPDPVAINTGSSLTANVDDSTTGGTNIVSAGYSIDGGPFSPMTGAFNQVSVNVIASVAPFATAGLHTVCVQGTDAAGNVSASQCVLLVVYDPTGGFVTGGGTVNSAAGADLVNTSAAGPATFGFNSKYLKGKSTPDGNLEFQFKAGNLEFKSTSMDWLVVTGQPRAQFQGTGTINGTTVCKFAVDAWDASFQNVTASNADAFGLKIFSCTGGGDRYSLPASPLKQGSIIIHK